MNGELTSAIEKFEADVVAAENPAAVEKVVNHLNKAIAATLAAAIKDPIVVANASMVSAALALSNAMVLANTLRAAGVANP